jgi:hypothetical protein
MKIEVGDQVEVKAEVTVTDLDVGTVIGWDYGRIIVRFPDGWTRTYQYHELRVVGEKAQRAAP